MAERFEDVDHETVLARSVSDFTAFHVYHVSDDGKDLHYFAETPHGALEWGVRRWSPVNHRGPEGTLVSRWAPTLLWCTQLTRGSEIGSFLDFVADGPDASRGMVWFVGHNVAGTVEEGPLGPVADPSPGGPVRVWWTAGDAEAGDDPHLHIAYRRRYNVQGGTSYFLCPIESSALHALRLAIPLVSLSALSFPDLRTYAAERGYDASGTRSKILKRITRTALEPDPIQSPSRSDSERRLAGLPFNELRTLARTRGVPATGTRDEILKRLRALPT